MRNDTLPDWEQVLSAAARLQRLDETNLTEYKNLDLRWQDWETVKSTCADCATLIFDRTCGSA